MGNNIRFPIRQEVNRKSFLHFPVESLGNFLISLPVFHVKQDSRWSLVYSVYIAMQSFACHHHGNPSFWKITFQGFEAPNLVQDFRVFLRGKKNRNMDVLLTVILFMTAVGTMHGCLCDNTRNNWFSVPTALAKKP